MDHVVLKNIGKEKKERKQASKLEFGEFAESFANGSRRNIAQSNRTPTPSPARSMKNGFKIGKRNETLRSVLERKWRSPVLALKETTARSAFGVGVRVEIEPWGKASR